MRVGNKDAPSDEVCINGMFVYTMKHDSLHARHVKTEAYVDGRRRPDVHSCA